MDFHTLSRKQLQVLCKKNKIPANMTNVAMADSLAALEKVEGIEEVLNPVDTDAQMFPDEKGVGTPACRTSTRRKPVMEEPESSKISTRLRRGTRARNDEVIDQENKDLNVPETPVVPTARRRAPAVSTRRKKEDEKPTDHVPKTPAASNSRVKATSAYNTRRSVRLLEKSLSKMSLMDKEETEDTEELTSVYQQIEDSGDTENGASSLAISTEVIEKTDESELTSSEKNLSKISFVDADETESVKVDEISEEMTVLPQKIEESEDAVEGANSQTISAEVIEKTDGLELTSAEENTEFECQSKDSNSEMPLVSEEASDRAASLQGEPQEGLMEINESGSPLKDMNNISDSDVELTKSITKEVNDANNESGNGIICQIENSYDSSEPENNISPCTENDRFSGDNQKSKEYSNMENDIQNSELLLSSHVENEAVVKLEDDSAEIHVSKVDDEVDPSMIVEDKNEESEHSNVGNYIQNSGGIFCSEDNKEAVEIEFQNPEEMFSAEEAVEIAHDIQEEAISAENKAIETAYDNQNSEEMFSAENKAVETFCDIQSSEEMFSSEKKVVEVEDNMSPLVHEEFEFKTSSDIEESKEHVEKDAVMEVCNEPSSEGNTDVQSAADSQSSGGNMNAQGVEDSQFPLVINEAKAESETADAQSSLVRNEAEAESETTDVQIANEDSKENADVPAVTFAPISSEQKTTDVPIQFACQDQSALKDNAAVEVKSVRKMCDEEGDKQKENQINDDLTSKSMRQLRKMLKNLSLDNKTNNDKSSNPVKEVEKKRTALQELPENRMTAS